MQPLERGGWRRGGQLLSPFQVPGPDDEQNLVSGATNHHLSLGLAGEMLPQTRPSLGKLVMGTEGCGGAVEMSRL